MILKKIIRPLINLFRIKIVSIAPHINFFFQILGWQGTNFGFHKSMSLQFHLKNFEELCQVYGDENYTCQNWIKILRFWKFCN